MTLTFTNGATPSSYVRGDQVDIPFTFHEGKQLRFINEVDYEGQHADSSRDHLGLINVFGIFKNVTSRYISGLIPFDAGAAFSNRTIGYNPWGYIRNSWGSGTNSVPLQNVHAFTDTVDYNAAIVSGYMSPFWSALEERMAAIDIDEDDPVSSQMQRFFGTKNKVSQNQDGFLSFEDVWDYSRWSVERSGDLGIANIGSTANVPRLILETSRKIFNNGKLFEVHFAPVARRNVLNGTEHYTHFVGFNGYYVTGLYNEDTAEYEWKSEDVFQVFASNPLVINPELSVTSIHFADNIHETDKKGVVTFKLSEEEFENFPEGKDYQWAFYPRRPVLKEGIELDEFDIEIFSQEAAGIDPSSLNMLRESMDFRPEEAENWRPLDFGVLNLEPIFNDSFVTTNEKGQTEMWLCGDHGTIIHSIWDRNLTSQGDYIGFANFEIQNIDNAYARQKAIKAVTSEGVAGVADDPRIVSLAQLASLRGLGFNIEALLEFIKGDGEGVFTEFPSIASVDLKTIFFIGKDTATDNNQIGKYGWAAGGQGSILKTIDGGKTWATISLIGEHNTVSWAEFAADWNSGGTDISDFARLAAQWNSKEIVCNKIMFYDIDNGFVTTNKGIYKTSDGGQTWFLDKNSLTIGMTQEWTDLIVLPERYRLWDQSLFPKIYALNPVDSTTAVDWSVSKGHSKYHHKSTIGIGGSPINIEVGTKELKGTPYIENNITWPEPLGSSDELPSKEKAKTIPATREGYIFYPSNKMSLHLYDPSRHIREDL